MSTQHQVAVVTGASQGIGEGLVRGFLDRGYQVVANSRSIKPDPSANVVSVAGDISDPAVADRVIGEAIEKFGRVDTLVNNAGIFLAKPFIEYTEADYAAVLAVNLGGFFHISQRAIRQMLKQGGGHVVNITTTLVNQPVKGVPSALASLTKGGWMLSRDPWQSSTPTRESASTRSHRASSRRRCMRPKRTSFSLDCIPWDEWEKSRKSSMRSCTWNRPDS